MQTRNASCYRRCNEDVHELMAVHDQKMKKVQVHSEIQSKISEALSIFMERFSNGYSRNTIHRKIAYLFDEQRAPALATTLASFLLYFISVPI